MTFDYIIIGGGITGITAGRLLQLSGVENIAILEAGAEAGGLCRTRQIKGHVLDIGGGHFLCSKYPDVYRFVFAHLPQEAFNSFTRVSRVALDGAEIDYPVESNLWQLPPETCADYLISAAQNGEARGLPAPTDFEAWIRWKLGDRIAERYMLPYNRKIWGVEASEMDIDWLHKIPRIDLREIAVACLRRSMDRDKMPSHSTFYYPKAGGFQEIFDAIAAPLRDRIHLSTPVNRIERDGDALLINGQLRARAVINTVPWSHLAGSPIFDADTRAAIARLRHNDIVVSLHEEPIQTDAHWLYQPNEALPHHRSFFIPNFAPHSAANGIYRETNIKRWQPGHEELFSHCNNHAYPIPTLGWADAINQILAHTRSLGIHGLGRWGQWQYFNSDVCIKEAMQLVERLGHHGWKQTVA
ncbi:MAG: NAD(P)/FAD-dependent oxidoreductase [Rariglobus sp.]